MIDIGYLRLTDAAPLIAAYEMDYYGDEGLTVTLHQALSWADLRDRLVSGSLQAAQMLAPMPAMSALGVNGVRADLMTGLVLSTHGNGVTLSRALKNRLGSAATDGALADVVSDGPPLTFATVHAFSTHTVLLRRWLRSQGVDPDKQVNTIVVPPAQVVDSLDTGMVDGFCAGEPWNSLAVAQGVGHIEALGEDIWRYAPDKVLAVSRAWDAQATDTHHALRRAIARAGAWLSDPTNWEDAALMLSHERYIGLSAELVLPALSGRAADGPRSQILFDGQRVRTPSDTDLISLLRDSAEVLGKPLQLSPEDAWFRGIYRFDLFGEFAAPLGVS